MRPDLATMVVRDTSFDGRRTDKVLAHLEEWFSQLLVSRLWIGRALQINFSGSEGELAEARHINSLAVSQLLRDVRTESPPDIPHFRIVDCVLTSKSICT